MTDKITSKTNKKVIHAASLQNKKYIYEYKEFLLEGIKAISIAYKAGYVKEIFSIKELEDFNDVPIHLVTSDILNKISYSINPEGVIAICRLLDKNDDDNWHKVVYFDDVQDPGNMGTLIRTALAFNYDGIIVSKNSVSIYNPKVVAASKGAMFLIPIIEGDLKDFKKERTIITSTLNNQSISLDELDKPKDFILVLGNEAHGVSEDVIALSDIFVKIPISNIDSLNVSIAGGILMNHLK